MANLDFQNGYMVGIAASGTAKGGGGGTSVQADWNQNDDSQMSYIQNRPFYSESVTVDDFTITPVDEATVFDLVPQCEEGEKIKVEYSLGGEVVAEVEGTVMNMGEAFGIDKLYALLIQPEDEESDPYGYVIFGAVMADSSSVPELSDTQSTYLDMMGVYQMGADVKIYKSVTTESVIPLPEKFLPSTGDNSFEVVYNCMAPSIFEENYRLDGQPIWTDPSVAQTFIPYTFNHQHYFTRHLYGDNYNLSYSPDYSDDEAIIPNSEFTHSGSIASEVAFMENEDGTLEMFNVARVGYYDNYDAVMIPAFSSLEIEIEDTVVAGGTGVGIGFMSATNSQIFNYSYSYIQNNQKDTIAHVEGYGAAVATGISHSQTSTLGRVPYMAPYQAKIECTAEKYSIKVLGEVYKQEGYNFPYRAYPKEIVAPEEKPQYQLSGAIEIDNEFVQRSEEEGVPCDVHCFNILIITAPKADTKITIRGKKA